MSAYATHPAGRFFDLIDSTVGYEIKAGNTVSFISEVDLTEVEAVRAECGRKRPSYTAFVVKALGMALKEFPYANRRLYRSAWWPFGGLRFQRFQTADIGVACERLNDDAEVAAFIDILRDADTRSLMDIDRWLRELATCDAESNRQWREFRWVATRLPRWLGALLIRLPVFLPGLWAKYRGGAAVVSSPAKYGIDLVNGSWTAALGVSFGLVKPRAVVVNGRVVARTTFNFLLNFDRRIMAGAQAAQFYRRIIDILESPRSEMQIPAPTRDKSTRSASRERLPAERSLEEVRA